jgi:hypothetical protein
MASMNYFDLNTSNSTNTVLNLEERRKYMIIDGCGQGDAVGSSILLFYFLFYTAGDLRTFTLLFYVVLFLGLY